MAFQISFQFPLLNPAKPSSSKPSPFSNSKLASFFTTKHPTIPKIKPTQFTTKSTQSTTTTNNGNNEPEQDENPQESQIATSEPQPTSNADASDLGSQIKAAMEERRERGAAGGGDFWSGVAEEVREIEWPPFGKVVGTTGVVLGVIAGSSVVLLTVNAVLAELSDRVFAGRGVQDFFG